jgi:3-oxoacyl-(acyl-carrier-protein) synthase
VHSRVFVRAAAAYTCCGLGCEAFWNHFGPQHLDVRKAPARFPLDENLTSTRSKGTHSLVERLLTAVEHDLGRLLRDLGIEEREQTGVALGSAYGHLSSYFGYYEKATRGGYQSVNPRHFPLTLPNFCTSELSATYSLWGCSTSISSGVGAGLEAVGYAASAIRRGEERNMIAGGLDELTEYNLEVLERMGLRSLSGCMLPFAPERDGTLPGEAVALVFLGSVPAAARTSGHMAVAEICSFASGRSVRWDSYGASDRAKEIVLDTLAFAGSEPTTIDVVFPSASGSIPGDEVELELLQKVFGSHLSSVLICPTKSVTGECFAASGPLQVLGAARCCILQRTQEVKSQQQAWSGRTLNIIHELQPASNALVYSAGYDGSFTAMLLRRAIV